MLKDNFGRTLDYLRISITDRCNLRCVYCMPQEGVEWKPHGSILTFEEIIRITKIIANLGIKNIKVTGGEPLLRRGASSLLNELKTIKGIGKVTLTTNGILLSAYLDEADAAGHSLPDGINISLDALDCERYKQITRIENTASAVSNALTVQPSAVLSGIERLLKKRVTVKINCVPMRSVNEQEIIPLACLAKDNDITVRFIELMPIGAGANFQPVAGKETAAIIEKEFGVMLPVDVHGSGPAVYYSVTGFKGKIGFINAVTHGFCETCNRLRLTSEGFLKPCLSNAFGFNLKELMRNGADDSEIAKAVIETVSKKPRFHTLSDIYCAQENHIIGMSMIGG